MNNKGFTLTELLAVIAIIAVLSIAAISGYTTMTKNSKKKSYESKVEEIENAALKYAKETNLKTSTTISVNKLVVYGFIQPDESTDSGLSSINNPQNNENMICNLVRITIHDDVYVAEYNDSKKDCEVAEQDMVDMDISINVYKLDGATIDRSKDLLNNNISDWTKSDVVLVTGSTKYADYVSISYDFDGKTTTKDKNNPISNNVYNAEDCNKFAINDVLVMLNSEVTVTYNMADGSTHSRTIVVRIDKEPPTGRASETNDITVASTKKVDLYLDDGNGSGVESFKLSRTLDFSSPKIINKKAEALDTSEGTGSFNGYKSYFYGEKGTYYIIVYDKAGNESEVNQVDLSNFDTELNTCNISVYSIATGNELDDTWYNENIRIKGESNNDIGTMGVKYFIGPNANLPTEAQLKKIFIPKAGVNKLSDTYDQTEEIDLTDFYLAMQGLSKNNNDIKDTHCKTNLGVDKTKPTVTLTCSDCDTYEKTHSVSITVEDERSGFYSTSNSIEVGLSTSNTTPPADSKWKEVTGGNVSGKKVTFTTTINQNNGEDALSGEYYMWVRGISIEDKAHNNPNNTVSTFLIKYDNTPPTCTSRGGKTAWQSSGFSIFGDCSDTQSQCAKHDKVGDTTYDNDGNITKPYSAEIDSKKESPGTVYDKAGNHADCPANQEVHIDLHDPECSSSGGSNSWRGISSSPVTIKGTCSDTGGSGCKADVTKEYSTNTNKSESPGTVYDNANRSKVCAAQTVKLDVTKPVISNVKVASRNSDYHTKSVDITVKGNDQGGSSISKVCIQTTDSLSKCSWQNFDGDEKYTNIAASSKQDGTTVTFYVWTKDGAGNVSDKKTENYKVYNNCTTTVNDGNATCGTYGSCNNGTRYADKTQKKKDKFTGVACDAVVTKNGCSESCCSAAHPEGCDTVYACDTTRMVFHKSPFTCSGWGEETGDYVTPEGVITPVKLIATNAATLDGLYLHKISYRGTTYFVRDACISYTNSPCNAACPG